MFIVEVPETTTTTSGVEVSSEGENNVFFMSLIALFFKNATILVANQQVQFFNFGNCMHVNGLFPGHCFATTEFFLVLELC